MADDAAAPAAQDVAPAGGNVDSVQQAAIAAADQAVSRYEANEAAERATGRAGGTADAPRVDHDAPAVIPGTEDLIDFEDYYSRGLAYENAGLETDKPDDGAAADVEDEEAEGTDEAPSSATDDDEAEEVGDPGDADTAEAEQRTVPEDAAERAAFLPDAADGYDLPAVEGHVWNPGAEAIWKSLAASVLHDHDAPQGFLDAVGTWAVEEMPKIIEQNLKQQDREHNKAVRETLRDSWGDDFKGNLAETKAFFQSLPANVRGEIKAARLPDGRRLTSSPDFLSMLHETARKNSGRAPSVSERLKEIRTVMKEDISQYRAQGLDKEYQQLLERAESDSGTTVGASPAYADPDEQRIAELKRQMRVDRESYFRDGGSTEYEQLLAKREKRKSAA